MAIKIKEFHNRIRLTQKQLAEKLSCSQSLVAGWDKGKRYPTYENLCKLIDLGITAEELFGKELAQKLIDRSYRPSGDSDKVHITEKVLSEALMRAAEILGGNSQK